MEQGDRHVTAYVATASPKYGNYDPQPSNNDTGNGKGITASQKAAEIMKTFAEGRFSVC